MQNKVVWIAVAILVSAGVIFTVVNNNKRKAGVAAEAEKTAINSLLASHGVKTSDQSSVLHAAALACPAMPTCGLALAESERMLPGLIDRIEALCGEVGLRGEEIIIRSTG